jgi:hypothetical protein
VESGRWQAKTKNICNINKLRSFVAGLDCTSANNRLKRPRVGKSSEERLSVRAGKRSQQQK